jgi:hypothetical protein
MKPTLALATALLLAGTTGGCASWDGHGWGHAKAEPITDKAKAQCETATETLKGKPDHDTALRACLDEKARRGK